MYSEYQIFVNVIDENNSEDEVEVIINLDDIYMLDDLEEIIEYIKLKTKQQYNNIKEVNYGI